MSNCCTTSNEQTGNGNSQEHPFLCPTKGAAGREVPLTAVASLVKWEVEPSLLVDSKYFLCPDPSCATVYFGSGGAVITKEQLRVKVGFKESEGSITWCYCFGVTEEKIQQEVRATGQCTSKDRIVAEVKAGRCACHVKNPTGGCCLGDIAKAIKRAESRKNGAAAP